jgi:hypothetical protein
MPVIGGDHICTAAFKKLRAGDTTGYNQLTVQNPNASGGNAMWISGDGVNTMGTIAADRSWTFGPNAGTVTPDTLWVRGTADDIAFFNGTPA